MTWSYSTALATDKDRVRLYIGDTDPADPQLRDEEIVFLLADEPNPLSAAINAADSLAAKYARKTSIGVVAPAGITADLSVIAEHYRDLASRLRMRLARRGVAPYAGGLSIAEKRADIESSDLVQPFARKTAAGEPGTDPADTGNPPATI